jgi:hypothetical protein
MAQGIGRFNLFGQSHRRLDRIDFAKWLRDQRQRVGLTLEASEQRFRSRVRDHRRSGDTFTVLVRRGHHTTAYVEDEQPFDLSAEAGRIRRRYQE